MPKDRTKAELLLFIEEQDRNHSEALATREREHAFALKQAHSESERQSKRAAKLDETVSNLKDDLYALSTKSARLEGYIARANEDDPTPPEPIVRRFGPKQQPGRLENPTVTWGGVDRAGGQSNPKDWWNR